MNLDFVLANEIRYLIKKNRLKEGDGLPSERELCSLFGVQRLTIRSALHLLEEEKILYAKPKSGYYIGKPRITKDVKNIASMTDELSSLCVNASIRLLSLEKTEVSKRLLEPLRLPIGARIYRIRRLRIVDGEPVCVDISCLPTACCPGLEEHALEQDSLYRILSDVYRIQLKKSEQVVDVVPANEEIRSLLCLSDNERVIFQHGSVFDGEGRLIEYSESYMKPSRFIYED